MNKKVASGIMAAGLIATSIVSLAACGDESLTSKDFNYIVLEENNENVLHKLKSWMRYDEGQFIITCECCNNNIVASPINFIMYKNEPVSSAYDKVCEQWVLE